MHDPAIGRFFCVDPISDKYVYNSPYAFAENKLGLGVELEGLELGPMPYFFFARPAPTVRPVVETMVKTNGTGRTTGQGLQNAARVGRQTHAEQRPKMESEGYQTEVKIGEGNRVDGIKIEQNQDGTSTGFVKELKPNTPSGRTRGLKQLERYIDSASKKHPEVTDWQPELELYQLLAPTANTENNSSSSSNGSNSSSDSDSNSSQDGSSDSMKYTPTPSDATRTQSVVPPTINPCPNPTDCA